ncbi:MAG: hypothetical protein MI802_16420, partial [Desulfobacterales bacterium]|nr:hypothetical protein [Desulfobacterales bacterium]
MTALDSLLHRLSSLKITVTLLALSIFLVFAGTIAQTTQGIWPVVDGYFRSLYVWIDIAIFVPGGYEAPSFSFPYPGGWLLGGLLLTNLLAAQVTRFHYTWKRSGILLSHLGLLALMLSELVTGLVAQEAQFVFVKGQTAHYAEDIREFELALIDTSHPDRDDVWVVPESRLKPGRTLTDPILPFHIEILSVYPNSRVDQNTPSGDLPYTIKRYCL